jgi:hypothetical protein
MAWHTLLYLVAEVRASSSATYSRSIFYFASENMYCDSCSKSSPALCVKITKGNQDICLSAKCQHIEYFFQFVVSCNIAKFDTIFFGTINTLCEIINYHSQTVKNIQKATIRMIHSKTKQAIFQRAHMLLLLRDSMRVVQ